ncbi:MAG: response regulator [Gemmatimonadetes bacterium]|nr:response regulator [Gemmatimonadota bacterium]
MRPPLVLLVNSDEDSRTILRDALEHAGYDVISSPTGAEGLSLADARCPDVIIGDFPMEVPGHSPFTGDVRKNPRLEHTRLLVVTSRALDHEVEAARAVSDAVLVKPVKPGRVVDEVARLIAGS